MQVSDGPRDYYRLRETQEREMAAKAQDGSARQIHLELAEKYRELAEASDGRP